MNLLLWLKKNEPVVVNNEPVVVNNEPVVNDEPVVVNNQPVIVNNETVVIVNDAWLFVYLSFFSFSNLGAKINKWPHPPKFHKCKAFELLFCLEKKIQYIFCNKCNFSVF